MVNKEVTKVGDNVVVMVVDGKTYVPDKKNATEEAMHEIVRDKALKKKIELEAGLKISLRDDVIN